MLLGLISDTHGHVGEDALRALAGCGQVLHAGDVGDGVLEPLRALAPVVAVRGNTDVAGEAAGLPLHQALEADGRRVVVVHRLADAPPDGWDVLVFGHCHRRHEEWRDGRLLVNPGAAGRRGFHRERSVATLDLRGSRCEVRFVDLGLRREAR